MSQYKLMEEYVQCLQRQNQAKNKQRQTLYTEIERLQFDFKAIEEELIVSRGKTTDYNELMQLRLRVRDLQEQVQILKYEQEHLFEENLSLISGLQGRENRIREIQRDNKELRSQKEELQKFRLALQRIGQSLSEIQSERAYLSQANFSLVQQNSYLKGLLQSSQQRFLPVCEQNIVQSSYLVSGSFQNISEHQEEYEESYEDSKQKSKRFTESPFSKKSNQSQDNSRRINGSPNNCSSNNGSNGDQSESQIPLNMVYRRKDIRKDILKESFSNEKHNNSSYLMVDEKSVEVLRLSCENNQQEQDNSNPNISNDLMIQNFGKVDKHSNHNIAFKTFRKSNDQSSCEVIQQLQEQSLSYQPQQETTQRTQPNTKISQLQALNQSLQQQLLIVEERYIQSQNQRQFLQNKIIHMQRAEQQNILQMEHKIQQLLINYDTIVRHAQNLQHENTQYSRKINQMENQNTNCFRKIQQLENSLHIAQNSHRSAKSLQQEKPKSIKSFNTNNSQYDIDEGFLIRQNNMLIQKMNQIEIEKNSLYHQAKNSQYSPRTHTSQLYQHNEDNKENIMHINRPSFNSVCSVKKSIPNYLCQNISPQQKFHVRSKSLSFQNHLTAKSKRNSQGLISESESNDRSEIKLVENRLQKRIQRIKEENQMLLQELQLF